MEKHEENVKACSIVCTFENNNCSLIHHVKSNFLFCCYCCYWCWCWCCCVRVCVRLIVLEYLSAVHNSRAHYRQTRSLLILIKLDHLSSLVSAVLNMVRFIDCFVVAIFAVVPIWDIGEKCVEEMKNNRFPLHTMWTTETLKSSATNEARYTNKQTSCAAGELVERYKMRLNPNILYKPFKISNQSRRFSFDICLNTIFVLFCRISIFTMNISM